MRILVITDMEGVAGVVNSADYARPGWRYYEVARELTTLEVNAAIEGALAAGATEFLVIDGHGPGALDPVRLHPAAQLLIGRPRPSAFPYPCPGQFDAAFMVGQHAKSNTDGGHLAHTLSFGVEELTVNGVSLGEIGRNFLSAAHSGIPFVFLSGDQAACEEAQALVPNIETVAVKEGTKRGSASGLLEEENRRFNAAAIHVHPEKARAMICEGVQRALARVNEIEPFWLEPPYELIQTRRPEVEGESFTVAQLHGDDWIELIRQPLTYEVMAD